MQILWQFAFLLLHKRETRLRTFVHTRKNKQEEKHISNQPIIFNITYTPYRIKSNATAEERVKFERERPYYEMSDSGNNIYKYMTSDRKLNGENSKTETRSLINYFEKSTGVFNGDGVITQEQLKGIQQRATAPKNIWHGFISLNKEMSHKIDSPEKCMRLIKRTFGEFFKDMGLDPNNVDLICALHKDKPHHLHIHFWFAEKKPRCKYRKKETEYRHKGKIDKSVLDRMQVRLNLDIMQSHPKLYVSRDEALGELKKISALRDIITKDDVKEAVLALAKTIPKDCSFHYGSRDMIPYREQIDKTVNKLLLYDKTALKANRRFDTELQLLCRKVDGLIVGTGEQTNHYKIDPNNITLIDELKNDYKRRQGNILLRTVKYIKSETFETRIRHKVNDKGLKRRLAISHRKVGKLFDSLLASFGSESELLERDFTNRLQEIEKEIEEEKEVQNNVEITQSRINIR